MMVKVVVDGTPQAIEVFVEKHALVSGVLSAAGLDPYGYRQMRVTGVPVCTETPLRENDILWVKR